MKTVVKGKLFEDRRPSCFSYAYLYPELLKELPGASRKEILDLSLRMEFMLHEECYEAGMAKIRHAALSREERTAVFISSACTGRSFPERILPGILRRWEALGGGISGGNGLAKYGAWC